MLRWQVLCVFQDGRKLGYGAMQGIPMVASSPVRHDSPLGMHPLDVQAYQPPWKALSDFALHTDLEQPHTPAFQHLVNQVNIHTYIHYIDTYRHTLHTAAIVLVNSIL